MAEVDWLFCYRHFKPLRDHFRSYSVLSIDMKLPEYERKKLTYINESLRTMAIRAQLLTPLACFLPILLTPTKTKVTRFVKVSLSVVMALGIPRVYRDTQNIGIFLALPSAISMVLTDAASGNRTSREMAALLEDLRQRDAASKTQTS